MDDRLATALASLRDVERRLAETQQLTQTGSWELDIATNRVWWSEEAYRIFELPFDVSPSYSTFLQLVHPDDRERVQHLFAASVVARTPYEADHRLLMPDGRVKFLRETGRTSYDEDGTAVRSFGSVQDVTTRVEEQQRLEAADRRFRVLVEQSTDVLAVVAPDGRFTFLNATFGTLLHQQSDAWPGRPFLDLVWPDDRAAAASTLERILAAPRAVVCWRWRIRHGDGGFRLLEGVGVNHVDDEAVQGVVINGRDVSQRVTAEAALRTSEYRLRQAVDVAGLGLFDHDHRTETVYWSSRQREIYGVDPEAPITLEDFARFVHPDDREWVMASVRQAHDPAGDGVWTVEHRILRSDGALRWVVARSHTEFAGEGTSRRPVRTVGAVMDVTDLHHADEAMRLLSQATASAMTPICFADAESRIIYANPAFVRALGYTSEDEILGRMPDEFANADAVAAVVRQLREGRPFQGELTARRKDGTTVDVLLSAHSQFNAEGRLTHMMASFLDVSESKRLQAELLQAQKMESIGRLAGGVAHDFNNLLTVINGFTALTLAELSPLDPRYEALSQVASAGEAATRVTQQLLAFSRKQMIKPEVLDLRDVINGLQGILRGLIGEDIDLRVCPFDRPVLIRFDRSQCEQMLVNLAANARDAMPEGGQLSIETRIVSLDEAHCRSHTGIAPGEFAVLAVSDSGVGMDSATQAHLFEPFFTTKGPGRGTGLGLPMVFGAVSQNGGRIEVHSELGHGTTFTVYLPAVIDEKASSSSRVQSGEAPKGVEVVMVVEDDDSVRKLATVVLLQAGYRVHSYATAEDALRALDEIADDVALLITDVVMPGMNGRALAERVLAKRPSTRVLFTSGYSDNVIARRGILEPGVDFLSKPYSVAELTSRVREAIDRKPIDPTSATGAL